jgi:lipopolysaccharide biosynthesis glycosyltransferase
MNASSPIQIAFACDEGYARHVAVVMRSILANANADARHEFLTMGLSDESELRLAIVASGGGASLQVHRVDKHRLDGFPENQHTLNAYLRLLLPELLPATSRILYLDADLLVFLPLNELWNVDLSDAMAAAAIDASYLFGGTSLDHFVHIGLAPPQRYFNSGVLLINLDASREADVFARIRAWAHDHSDLMMHSDQDALNVVLAGEVMPLHLRWNLQVPLIDPVKYGWGCTLEMAEAVANPGIVHYTGTAKPWRGEFPLLHQSLYFQYLAETPWANDPLPEFGIHQRMQRLGRQLDACYKWTRSELRRALGRHPAPSLRTNHWQ